MSGRFANKPDGYRFVREQRREYCTHCGRFKRDSNARTCKHCGLSSSVLSVVERTTWALYEVRDGRARRVGTARSEREYLTFLGLPADWPLPSAYPTTQEVDRGTS